MSGERHHFIPRLLQKYFSIESKSNKEKRIWVLDRSGKKYSCNIKDSGVERFFYSQTTESSLDDLITNEEARFDQILIQLKDGITNQNTPIAEMIAHFEIRNKSLRSNMLQIGSTFFDGLERILSDESHVHRLVEKIFSPNAKPLLDALKEKGIPPDLFSQLIKQQPQLITIVHQQAADAFAIFLKNFDRQEILKLARSAHIKAIAQDLSPRAKVEQYSKLNYQIITLSSKALPLGDTIVFFETESERRYTSFLQKGDTLLSVFMPLSPSQYLVGTSKSSAPFTHQDLPSIIASTSYDFILAPSDSEHFTRLIPEIGKAASIFDHNEIEGIFEASFHDFINQ